MAGATIMGLSAATFPVLKAASNYVEPAKVFTEKQWAYIDAANKEREENPPLLFWNPYPAGTMFDSSGDPLNCEPKTILLSQLVDKHGDYPTNDTPLPVYGDSSKETYPQDNVDQYHPWRCHTCGGGGLSVIEKESTYTQPGGWEAKNTLDCPACWGTGKEACPMYDVLSEADQKTEYKAHQQNGDF